MLDFWRGKRKKLLEKYFLIIKLENILSKNMNVNHFNIFHNEDNIIYKEGLSTGDPH